MLGPVKVLDDDAEERVAVMVIYGSQTRIASSLLPVADVERVLRLSREETGRMQQAGERARISIENPARPRTWMPARRLSAVEALGRG
jgi:hypothetical protein